MLKLLNEIAGETILISGATGLIAKNIIYEIQEFNRHATKQIKIVALVRNLNKAEKIFGDDKNIHYVIGDVRNIDLSRIDADYIIHAASQTSSKSFTDKSIETIDVSIRGTVNLLEFAKTRKIKKFIFLSTMEIYGTPQTDEKISENYHSNLDCTDTRSSYPESKRMCETLCCCYSKEYGIPMNILRLTQTFGRGVLISDSRVFAEFSRCILEKRDIILKTKGLTKRSYLHTKDAVSAIITVIVNGGDCEVYNVANEDTYCSIYEMAVMVASRFADNKINVLIKEDNLNLNGYAATLCMNLDTKKIRGIGWKPTLGLEACFADTIEEMRKAENKSEV